MKIVWSTVYNDQFLTHSANSHINLYKIIKCTDHNVIKGSQVMRVAEDKYALHIGSYSEIQYVKNVAWYPGATDVEDLIAIGQPHGKITLTSFGQPTSSDYFGKEFAPKYQRNCLYLEWNTLKTNLIAEGLDRHRNDPCVVIWDINAKPNSDLTGSVSDRTRYSSSMSDTTIISKPLAEIGQGDITSSFSWFYKDATTFAVGLGNRAIKIFDMRDLTRPHVVTQTKCVNGICADPKLDYRLVSYHDNLVSVWDIRNFDKPIHTFQETKPVVKIKWCPTRLGLLAVLSKESLAIKLYDIRHTPNAADELESVVLERTLQPDSMGSPLTTFAWHPACENRMMTVSHAGTVSDLTVFERIPVAWSSKFQLARGCGRLMFVYGASSPCEEMDMSERIKHRVLKGYGYQINKVEHNAHIVQDEPHLHGLWNWLAAIRKMNVQFKNNIGRSMGLRGILKIPDDVPMMYTINSRVENLYWEDANGKRIPTLSFVKQYLSSERCLALQLCDWGNNKESFKIVVEDLLNQQKYTRAAAMALFNLKFGYAIEILGNCSQKPGMDNLSAVAMAIAGYTEESVMWKKTCANLLDTLTDSYLRAMFAFLSSGKEYYEDILQNADCMTVADRAAFACLYLPDHKLSEYINKLSAQLIEQGNLDGLLLTGMTEDGVRLLQEYIDNTGDIQTAALSAVFTFPSEMSTNPKVKLWIESFRELLDRWKLWHKRAEFDIIHHSNDTSSASRVNTPQAYVSCNFCGKSIACNNRAPARLMSRSMLHMPSNKPKIHCCPECRKPLPRCALCLSNLGTPSGSTIFMYQHKEKIDVQNKLSSLDDWFTWCQSCRHGGHTSHISAWFQDHPECPVTGCSCKCDTLDPLIRLVNDTSLELVSHS